jgi:hypothetical protein
MFGVFDPFNPPPDCTPVDALLADWDRQHHQETGRWYVYAFRDAAGSVFYIGKGQGNRAHDADRHRHGRLGYYIASCLGGSYTVEVLRNGLSPDDADFLESQLIEVFGQQLVNLESNSGAVLGCVISMGETANGLRARARAAAAGGRLEEAVALCQEALASLSGWEQADQEARVHELECLAQTWLGARVDLQKLRGDYVPHAPVLACECLSDLTRYLCTLGRAAEARREVEAFTERYPHGSFRDYEFFDHRYNRSVRVAVTKREQATLRRIERVLGPAGGQVTATP